MPKRTVLVCMIALLLCAGAVFVGCGNAGNSTTDGNNTQKQSSSTGDTAAFAQKMESQNYYVQQGTYECLDTLDLASKGQLISCFGNNTGSDYLVVKLPPAPEQDAAQGSEQLNWADETPTQYDDPG